jgi:hypothetical protein
MRLQSIFKKLKIHFMTTRLSLKSTFLFLIGITCMGWIACKPATPPDPNEEELITSVLIALRDSSGIEPNKSFMYRDLDGDGGAAPSVFDTIRLLSNKTYFADLYFLDESKQPADTISKEVLAEADEHLVCFTTSGVSMPIERLDKDGNNLPLGLKSKWNTGAASLGTLRLVLKHQPGNKNGSCEPGSSDIDLLFPLFVQ